MRNILHSTILLILLLLGGFGVAYADADDDDDDGGAVVSPVRYEKNISVIGTSSYAALEFDAEVLTHAQENLGDIRIYPRNQEGAHEIPYQRLDDTALLPIVPISAVNLRDVSTQKGEVWGIVSVGTSGALHGRITLVTSTHNFRRSVRVYGADTLLSHTSSAWRLLTEQGYVYDYTDPVTGESFRQLSVSYPETAVPYLRVVVGKGEGEVVTLQNVYLDHTPVEEHEMRSTLVTGRVMEHPDQKQTEIWWNLGSIHLPTRQVVLQVEDGQDFARRAEVFVSLDGKTWQAVGGGYLSQLHTDKYHANTLTLSYRETRARYVRVVVQNEDDAPVRFLPQASFLSDPRVIVFPVQPGGRYVLRYGERDDSPPPHYDLSRFFRYIDLAGVAHATLGKEEIIPGIPPPPPPPPPFSERYRRALNVFLVLLTALFLLIAVRAVRGILRSGSTPRAVGARGTETSSSITPSPESTDTPPPPSGA